MNFIRYYGNKAGRGFYYSYGNTNNTGELQFVVKDDWSSYPPRQEIYADNSGSYLLDVFVFDSTQLDEFKKFLRALIQQNPEDTEFSAGAQDFLKGALQHPKQESEGVWAEPINGMKFVIVPGGSFLMGSPSSEEGRRDNENLHLVHVGKFHLMETELTQAQWKSIMGSNPSHFMGEERPVERVSLDEVQKFIKKLNSRTGERFRLPTEAEWEYACREGGRKVRFCNSSDLANPSEMNFNGSAEKKKPYSVAGEYLEETTPAESFPPNSLGLYDMSGNVWEWTCSEYQDRYDGSEERCADQADRYSLRGGSWGSFPWGVRAAYRNHHLLPASRNDHIGFRLARDN